MGSTFIELSKVYDSVSYSLAGEAITNLKLVFTECHYAMVPKLLSDKTVVFGEKMFQQTEIAIHVLVSRIPGCPSLGISFSYCSIIVNDFYRQSFPEV